MRRRRTISAPAVFRGVGIHSGESSSVTISPSDSRGITFKFGDVIYSIRDAVISDTSRCTSLRFPGGESLRTVEHLLSAVAGMDIDDVRIETAGEELPILDGSALPFAEKIAALGVIESEEFISPRSIYVPISFESGRSVIAALPSEKLKVTYVIDYPGTVIGTQALEIAVTPHSFLRELAPARTFATIAEVEGLKAAGLALGGSLDNTLVIGGDGILNPGGSRLERECAAHKITDLLGDMALVGFPITAHYVCYCGGHKLHAGLAARIRGLFK